MDQALRRTDPGNPEWNRVVNRLWKCYVNHLKDLINILSDGVLLSVENGIGTSSPSQSWDFFDKVYCISLDDRKDRSEQARKQFGKVGLADRVEFVIAKRHPIDAEQGIYESHMACFRMGIRDDARTMVIFEDDIVFDRFNPAVLEGCVHFLSTTSSWDIFFFGCLSSGSERTVHDSVLKVRYHSLAHAYVVNRKYAEALLRLPWRHVPFDVLLRSLAGANYAAYPSFAFQSSARTDNTRNLKIDRLRRLCGGLLRIQKMNEFYHRNRWAIIGVHVFLLLVLLILALRHYSTGLL
jgi:GR25 family glycosyltransferase involved in LPS biosynthesis